MRAPSVMTSLRLSPCVVTSSPFLSVTSLSRLPLPDDITVPACDVTLIPLLDDVTHPFRVTSSHTP